MIDSQRMVIRVEQGKGAERPLRHLLFAQARSKHSAAIGAPRDQKEWLFPGDRPEYPDNNVGRRVGLQAGFRRSAPE